ncbi:hypothetical protein GE21DRAFT_1074104 [Neurospora crassa]|nr:hypothetical protein GE21DRAFT_1074104 [Neurospora crassa]
MILGSDGLSTIFPSANRSGPADRAVTGYIYDGSECESYVPKRLVDVMARLELQTSSHKRYRAIWATWLFLYWSIPGPKGLKYDQPTVSFTMNDWSSANGKKPFVFVTMSCMSWPHIAQRTNDMHRSPLETRI